MLPSSKVGLVEQLTVNAAKLLRETSAAKYWSLDHGDIPGVFRRMYEIADSLASREGLVWLHARYTPEEIARIRRKDSFRPAARQDEPPHPILEVQLLDYVNGRREDYMERMTDLLELYAKSRWADKEEPKK